MLLNRKREGGRPGGDVGATGPGNCDGVSACGCSGIVVAATAIAAAARRHEEHSSEQEAENQQPRQFPAARRAWCQA